MRKMDLDKIEVFRELTPEYCKQVIEAVEHLGKFKSARFLGEPVDSWVVLPIRIDRISDYAPRKFKKFAAFVSL